MTNYEEIILILIGMCGLTVYIAYHYYMKYKINYSNYQMALRALSDTDPKLKEYLEREESVSEGIVTGKID